MRRPSASAQLRGADRRPRTASSQTKGLRETAKEAAQAAADEMRYDSHTLERIRSITTAKQRAVEAEDYEEDPPRMNESQGQWFLVSFSFSGLFGWLD